MDRFILKIIGICIIFGKLRIDLTIALIIDVGLILDVSHITPVVYGIGNGMQLLTLAKFLAHFKNKSIKVIIDSLVFMIPSFLNIVIVIFINLLAYSIIGIELFWNIKYNNMLGERYNFQSFFRSLIILLECATGENWNGIMHSLSASSSNCVNYIQSFEDFDKNDVQGCGTWFAYPYFIIFTVFFTDRKSVV